MTQPHALIKFSIKKHTNPLRVVCHDNAVEINFLLLTANPMRNNKFLTVSKKGQTTPFERWTIKNSTGK